MGNFVSLTVAVIDALYHCVDRLTCKLGRPVLGHSGCKALCHDSLSSVVILLPCVDIKANLRPNQQKGRCLS